MTEITRNVILDLLPLYLASEVSEDTAMLVREYLDSDPDLAEIAKQQAKVNALNKIPIPLARDNVMEKFEDKKWRTIRAIGIATVVGATLMCLFLTIMVAMSIDVLATTRF